MQTKWVIILDRIVVKIICSPTFWFFEEKKPRKGCSLAPSWKAIKQKNENQKPKHKERQTHKLTNKNTGNFHAQAIMVRYMP